MAGFTQKDAQNRKPVAASINPSSREGKRKYEKEDFRATLKKLKGDSNKERSKPQTETVSLEIVAETFHYTKQEPMIFQGWNLWRSQNDQLIAMPEDLKEGERFYTFDLVDGILSIVRKPKIRYAYFHPKKFNDFIKQFGITRVKHQDPNGEYQGRNDTYKNTVSVFRFVTDGEWTQTETSDIRADEEPVVKMNYPSTFVQVKNATFVLFEQIAYRTDDESIPPFVLRQLVTDYDIYTLEDEIRQAVEVLDGQQDESEETA